MADQYWDQALAAVYPLLRPLDVVAAPVAGWPPLGVTLRPYKGSILLEGVTVLLLHKGQLAALRKPDLAAVWRSWQCVFANNVFVCFTRDRRIGLDRRFTAQRRFTRLPRDYLHASSLKQRRGTVFFLHLPKTAGTSIWHALGRQVRSKIYYDCIEAFLFNPPEPGEYDLVGGHIPASLLLPHLRSGDHLVGLVRHPTDRFRSAFLHSRRQAEDVGTFTAPMRAMRETPLRAFLQTLDGEKEVRQQLLMLGHAAGQPYATSFDPGILRAATDVVSRPNAFFLTGDTIPQFLGQVSGLLGIGPPRLPSLNGSKGGHRTGTEAEFADALALVEAGNEAERALYALLQHAAVRPAVRPRPRIAPAGAMALTVHADPS